MRIAEVIWDDWNEHHISRHGVETYEVEDVCFSARTLAVRIRSGRYRLLGQTEEGRYLTIILDASGDRGSYYVVTARDATLPERRRYRQVRG